MTKADFKKTLKHLYAPSAGAFVEVDVPAMQFLMVDGIGSPGEAPAYLSAVEWLFSLSYPLKFASKKELGRDYTVMPLEGLWWADDWSVFTAGNRDSWRWTMMVMQPDWITQEMVDLAIAKAQPKLGEPLETLRLERFAEGRSVQILHLGPYADEAPTIARMHDEYMPAHGLKPTGKHHEIYLSDPRRVAPEKMKTVLRQPVTPA